MTALSFNKVIIGGRLGGDPEIRTFQNGGRVARLSVAVNEQWTDEGGTVRKKTDWHPVVLFKKAAVDFAERNLNKGDLVLVEGRLEKRSYEKDRETREVTEIVVREGRGDIHLMARPRDEQTRERGKAAQAPAPAA